MSDKQGIVNEIASKMGVTDKADTVKNFLNTLAENNRLSVLEGVCEKFGTLMSAYKGEVELTITSAAVSNDHPFRVADVLDGTSRTQMDPNSKG